MGSIEFNSERHRYATENAMQELTRGRLPGIWGLAQEVVGHWTFLRAERGWLRYGKATLDTLGSVYTYRESKKQSKGIGQEPCQEWLRKQGYRLTFQGLGGGLNDFICKSLNDLAFEREKKRGETGQFSEKTLLSHKLPKGGSFFFIDNNVETSNTFGSSRPWWSGPFCKPDDREVLEQFIGDHIWERLNTSTIRLTRQFSFIDQDVKLEALSDEFDYLSCGDAWNNVKEMAERASAFMRQKRSRCLLFHGAPGCGKSTLARAIAREIQRKVLLVDREAMGALSGGACSKIISMLDPGVLILNDVDRANSDDYRGLLEALEQYRDKAVLTCLTANDITRLDPALLRPGRINKVLKIPEPSDESRAALIDYYADKNQVRLSDQQRTQIIEETSGFSPADIREICEVASAVGLEYAMGEIPRLKEQRKFYAGNACRDYNKSRDDTVGAY